MRKVMVVLEKFENHGIKLLELTQFASQIYQFTLILYGVRGPL